DVLPSAGRPVHYRHTYWWRWTQEKRSYKREAVESVSFRDLGELHKSREGQSSYKDKRGLLRSIKSGVRLAEFNEETLTSSCRWKTEAETLLWASSSPSYVCPVQNFEFRLQCPHLLQRFHYDGRRLRNATDAVSIPPLPSLASLKDHCDQTSYRLSGIVSHL
ncbi:hypothetical protein NHX12_007885, partial [Muraenolepis orangiensis]